MTLLLLLILLATETLSCELKIKETGINKMYHGDVGMVFYVILENPNKSQLHITVKMIQCVEAFPGNEEDSETITLIGGYMGIVYPQSELKATLIYPNMYLYNRKGLCKVAIYYTDEKHKTYEKRAKIPFCTMPRKGVAPAVVKDLYRRKDIKYCESPDLDQLENCQPVDCMMKYLGNRNYFHDHWKRCQKVPVCISDSDKDDPDVAYIPTSNRCRNLANCITESDISLLEEGLITNSTERLLSSRGIMVRCNNGVFDNSTGICKCRRGWTSTEPDSEKYLPGLSVYHMCNVQVDSWNAAHMARIRSTILAFAVLAVFITMVVLLVTFCLYGLHNFFKGYNASPFEQSNQQSEMDLDFYARKISPWSSTKSIHINN